MAKQRSTQGTSGRSSNRATTGNTQDQDLGFGQAEGEFSAQSGRQAGAQQGAGVIEKAQDLAGQVQQKATQRVESGLTRGKGQAAETLNTLAQSLVTSGQQLRERNQENVSRYVDQVADRVQRVSNYLQNTDVSEIIDSTEQFARRRPALFLGGAFALGLIGARFLKSSQRGATGSGQGAAGGGGAGMTRGGHLREGIKGIEQEVPARRSKEEWAAGAVGVTGFADVAGGGAQTLPLGEPVFGLEDAPLPYRAAPGGPEASQR
jgi:ElaB/YqjD/DUF883 family membrane-anchored ribosome-binding protein